MSFKECQENQNEPLMATCRLGEKTALEKATNICSCAYLSNFIYLRKQNNLSVYCLSKRKSDYMNIGMRNVID